MRLIFMIQTRKGSPTVGMWSVYSSFTYHTQKNNYCGSRKLIIITRRRVMHSLAASGGIPYVPTLIYEDKQIRVLHRLEVTYDTML